MQADLSSGLVMVLSFDHVQTKHVARVLTIVTTLAAVSCGAKTHDEPSIGISDDASATQDASAGEDASTSDTISIRAESSAETIQEASPVDGASSTTQDAEVGAVTTDPWPESCVPAAYLSRPASAFLLTGPAGSERFGDLARPGETMTAKMNGLARSYQSRFETAGNAIVGHGFDGSLGIAVPSLTVGEYSCPAAGIAFDNENAGPRDSNSARTKDCCKVQITKVGGIGETVEGTFSGILVHDPLESWIKVEDGRFSVVRR
jgi:hypothetical protein